MLDLKYISNVLNELFAQLQFKKFDHVLIISTNHNDKNNYLPIDKKFAYQKFVFKINNNINNNNNNNNNNNIIYSNEIFIKEHSWQIIIPYLKYYNVNNITPIIIGSYNPDFVKIIINNFITPTTLIIGNTDLLHCGPNYNASCNNPKHNDSITCHKIIDFLSLKTNADLPDLSNDSLCGKNAILTYLDCI